MIKPGPIVEIVSDTFKGRKLRTRGEHVFCLVVAWFELCDVLSGSGLKKKKVFIVLTKSVRVFVSSFFTRL